MCKKNKGSETTFIELYKSIVRPEIEKVHAVIIDQKSRDDKDELVKYWWSTFVSNIDSIATLVGKTQYFAQIITTFRHLLECAADVRFITENRQNLQRLLDIQKDVMTKQSSDPDNYTYRDVIEDMKRARIYRYDKKGKRKSSTTTDRMTQSYSKAHGKGLSDTTWLIYEYGSAYAHFNSVASVLERAKQGNKKHYSDNMFIFSYLLVPFSLMAESVAELLGIDLKYINIEPLVRAFDKLDRYIAVEEET